MTYCYMRTLFYSSLQKCTSKPWKYTLGIVRTRATGPSSTSGVGFHSEVTARSKLTRFLLNVPLGLICRVCLSKNKAEVVCKDIQIVPANTKTSNIQKKNKRSLAVKILRQLYKYITLYLRFLRLLLTFLPIYSVYPWTLFFPTFKSTWLHLLLFAVEISGPTFIKLGQWASTRRDLFSAELCDCFSKLHHDAPPHSWYYTKKKLERAFGKNWREIFVKIDNNRQAIQSGCIGQVYKGYMKAEKIADENLLEEILEELDETDVPDFFEGMEILGFGQLFGTRDLELDQAERERIALKREKDSATGIESCEPCNDKKVTLRQGGDEGVDDAEKATKETNMEMLTTKSVECGDCKESSDVEDDLEGLIPVAIKVLHPHVYRSVSRDMKLLYFWASALSCLPGLKWLSLQDIVEEFDTLLKKQIDLRVEAKNLDRFNQNFQDVPCIKFPKPIRPYVKRDVMVETFEEGEHVSKYLQDDDDSSEELKAKLATLGIDALLKMVFVDNFVHADLHPGNILVQGSCNFNPDEQSKLTLVDMCDTVIVNVKPVECPVKLVFLDTGITAELGQEDMESFRDVFTAVVLGDGEKVAELFLRHTKTHECKDVEKFKSDMASLVTEATKDTLNLGKMQVGLLLRNVFGVLINHKIKLESNFASMVLAIMVLEGLGRSLDPNLDILQSAKSILLPEL
ncbi:uncharacterized aarF domain-containing protein kinase 2-like [Ptychodera flava]|uniref:uncharacterized aarF domain-containing protein kinase 2-like n=1 Tax=Ptychodera flava TaxID=63121 RepID=UPI003969F510